MSTSSPSPPLGRLQYSYPYHEVLRCPHAPRAHVGFGLFLLRPVDGGPVLRVPQPRGDQLINPHLAIATFAATAPSTNHRHHRRYCAIYPTTAAAAIVIITTTTAATTAARGL